MVSKTLKGLQVQAATYRLVISTLNPQRSTALPLIFVRSVMHLGRCAWTSAGPTALRAAPSKRLPFPSAAKRREGFVRTKVYLTLILISACFILVTPMLVNSPYITCSWPHPTGKALQLHCCGVNHIGYFLFKLCLFVGHPNKPLTRACACHGHL